MRLRSRRQLSVKGIITFGAPCSGGFEGLLPAEAVLLVDQEPPNGAAGAWLVPEQYAHFELSFISEGTRKDSSYSGYAIACSFEEAAKNFDVL